MASTSSNSLTARRILPLVLATMVLASGPDRVEGNTTLFESSFDSFQVGANALIERDEWKGTPAGQGAHGTDPPGSGGIGASGYIGRLRPQPNIGFVSIRKPLNYDPVNGDQQAGEIIEFFSLVGIADSTNGSRDNFYISIYDTDTRLLGAINFDNTASQFGIYRYDGETYHPSPVRFVRGQIQELFIRINFTTGRWSAELNNLPIFRDAPLDLTGKERTLGSLAAEWEITSPDSPGNNWLLFDEWKVVADTPNFKPRVTFSVDRLQFEWESEAGYIYDVESSPDLATWASILDAAHSEKVVSESKRETSTIPLRNGEGRTPRAFFRIRRTAPAAAP
ncbi:MAG: hypothetical protein AAF514_11930 [Verrucomicrobiota bacterium]